jgi:N6-adenosine-specific RNA methylase IME4
MSVEEIRELPIKELAERDAHLYLWTTNRHLPIAFSVVAAWGFTYRQTLVWDKPRHIPLGSVAPQSSEYLLFGVRGNLGVTKGFPSTIIRASGHRPHSRKPEAFLDYIEGASPGPYLELFARRNRLGWDTWGNESLTHVEMDA